MAYVVSNHDSALMPCSNVIARLLLKSGKAIVKHREPFTIKLTYSTADRVRPHTMAVDTGSGTFGFAASNEKNEIIYRSEVIVRNDIKDKMDRRRVYRHTRRSHKLRYRKARFDNRKNSNRKGRINPTIESKIHSCEKEIKFIESIIPIDKIIFEVGSFDVAAIQDPRLRNPKVKPWGYRYGRNYGFENTKAKVRYRDDYTCQICKGKSKNHRLHVHHIVYRSQGGSDNEDNLITVCESCHKKIHEGKIKVNLAGKDRGNLRYATEMNVIRSQLVKRYPLARITWGYITATNRRDLGFNKASHWFDAAIIATNGNMPTFKDGAVYIKRCNSKGDYKQTKGKCGEIKLTRCKVMGFLKFDKVMYRDRLYFIKGCRSDGYAALMNIYGKSVSFAHLPRGMKTPKLTNMIRVAARSSWMVWTKWDWNVV